mgnify:CR=1 FL=1
MARIALRELVNVLGRDRALELAMLTARLTGLQHYRRMAEAVGGVDGGPVEAARFLAAMFEGMGDTCVIEDDPNMRGAPEGHTVPVREVRLSAGAEFVVALGAYRVARVFGGATRDGAVRALHVSEMANYRVNDVRDETWLRHRVKDRLSLALVTLACVGAGPAQAGGSIVARTVDSTS